MRLIRVRIGQKYNHTQIDQHSLRANHLQNQLNNKSTNNNNNTNKNKPSNSLDQTADHHQGKLILIIIIQDLVDIYHLKLSPLEEARIITNNNNSMIRVP